MNTPKEWYEERTKNIVKENLFPNLLKTQSTDLLKIGIESRNVQLINFVDNKVDEKLRIRDVPDLLVSSNFKDNELLFDIKIKEMITLNLKEYSPIETLKPNKILR